MYVYLNGEVKPKNQVNLSIDDRGFTFGEGIYEVQGVRREEVFAARAYGKA